MKIFCSISTAGRSLLPAALFGAVLISLAAAVLVFQMRREKWLQALNTTAFLLLFVLLNVVFSKIDRQGDTHGSIDLLSGEAIPLVSETHKSSDFVTFLKKLDEKYPKSDMIRIILDNHSAHTSKETQEYLNTVSGRFEFVFTPKHGSWLNMIEGFFSKMTKQMLGGIRVESKKELEDRIYRYFDEINKEPVPYKWTYKMDTIDLSQEDIDSIVYEVVNAKAASAENKNKKAPKTISRKRKSIQN